MSNLVTLYSPNGETFDGLTKANARDLVAHAGWTYEKVVAAATPAAPPAPVEPTPAEPTPAAPATEPPAAPVVTLTIRKTAEEFADLIDKDQVKAYLAEFFPAFKADGRASRDKLVAQAIELAAGHAIDEVEAESVDEIE